MSVYLHVATEIVLEHPHENDGQKSREEEDEHERVDGGEPVDLQGRREGEREKCERLV